jgi:hypothetical protein
MPRRACSMTILPRINGTPGFGFAEAITRDDGSVQRVGVLELRRSDSTQLRSTISGGEPLTYSGPVWVDGVWIDETFAVLATPEPSSRDGCVKLSIAECDAGSMAAPPSESGAAA